MSSLLIFPYCSADKPQAQHNSKILPKASASSRKRKRRQEEQEAGHLSPRIRDQPSIKRPRTSLPSCTVEVELEEDKERSSDINQKSADPLEYWTRTKRWPKEYFEQDSQVREDLIQDLDQDSWLEEEMENSTPGVVKYVEVNGFRLPCPIRKLPTSVRRKQSDSNLNDSSDQKSRENKSAKYRNAGYTILLERQGSYMNESEVGVTEASLSVCGTLLGSAQTVPKDSLFGDDVFQATCEKVQNKNEARVIRSITPFIVPSVEDLATLGATHLKHLIEGVNECWTGNIAVEGPLPKPDYSVGFKRSAFTRQQLKKLDPLFGSIFDTSLFVATCQMYFPFLTCEVKCGAASLDIADRQNAHSMTIAVRALIELYKAARREKELDRQILAFSISHDNTSVRIFGHYLVIQEDKTTTFYRHSIHAFDFTALNGKEKWTAYKFIKNVYDIWIPIQHKRICMAIDLMPDINFGLSQTASFPQSAPQSSQQSNADPIIGEGDSQPSFLASQEITPTTSFAPTIEPLSKKPRN